MDTAMTTLRWLHIAAGTVALFVAPGAMLTMKGGLAHRRWGKVYFWAMALVAASAIVLGLWRPNIFLALLALFSFYMAFSGYRSLFRKRPAQRPEAIDWIAALVTLAASAALVVLGLVRPGPAWQRVGIVPVVFGVLGLVLAGLDLAKFVRPPEDRHAWWFAHMGGMLGSWDTVPVTSEGPDTELVLADPPAEGVSLSGRAGGGVSATTGGPGSRSGPPRSGSVKS